MGATKPRARPRSFMEDPSEIGDRMRKIQTEEGRKPIDLLAPQNSRGDVALSIAIPFMLGL